MITGLSQCLLPDMEMLKKMLPIILDIKNANILQKIFFFKIVQTIECTILMSLLQ